MLSTLLIFLHLTHSVSPQHIVDPSSIIGFDRVNKDFTLPPQKSQHTSLLRFFNSGIINKNNPTRFQIKSNLHPDRCLTLQQIYGSYVVNPQTSRDDFIPIAFLSPCTNSNPAQMFSHTPDGKLEAAGRCLTPMATTDKNIYPSGDPCDVHTSLELAGTVLFGLACDSEENNYQKWVFSGGLIKSGCPHGYFITHDERFFALSGKDNYGDMVLARFANGDLNGISGIKHPMHHSNFNMSQVTGKQKRIYIFVSLFFQFLLFLSFCYFTFLFDVMAICFGDEIPKWKASRKD